jgi:membrane protease subunit HflK
VKRIAALALVLLVGYLATGLHFVRPDEQAIVRRCGAVSGPPREPGAFFGLPLGIDRVDRVKSREVKRVAVGPIRIAESSVGTAPAQFLTADRNLVNVRATVQFTVHDPAAYLTVSSEPDRLLASAAEASITAVFAGQAVDRALTLGKGQLSVEVTDQLQKLVDRCRIGVLVRSVDIAEVAPPPEVAEAFEMVTSSLRQREQAVNEGQSYASRTLEEARGRAGQRVDTARSDREGLVQRARGEASRFESVLIAYLRSPALTASRLYLETMADVLPRLRSKLIVGSGATLDLSILREEPK